MVSGAVGDGVLTVGTLLPTTGSLYFLGAATSAAAELAVRDVNAAGGVLGRPVRLIRADSGDTTRDIATAAVRNLLAQDTDLIVGAASNTVSTMVMDTVSEAGSVMISPSNTAAQLTSAYDRGLYFRTAPSDTLQGQLVGRLISEDRNRTVAVIALDDSYADTIVEHAERAMPGVRIVRTIRYGDGEREFGRVAADLARAAPDAVLLVGFEETVHVIRALRRHGLTPAAGRRWYLVDANLSDYSEDLPDGVMATAKGTLAGALPTDEFRRRVREVDPVVEDVSYGPESYDAVVLGALAAEAARGDLGQSIAARLADVSRGGRRCTTYQECVALVRAGEDIDYDGLSGRIEFDSNGDVGDRKSVV